MEFDRRVLDVFPGICVAEGDITGVHIKKENQGLQALKVEVAREIHPRYSLESVRKNLYSGLTVIFSGVWGLTPQRPAPPPKPS